MTNNNKVVASNVVAETTKRLTEKHLEVMRHRSQLSLYYQPGSLYFDTVEKSDSDTEQTLGSEIKLLRATILEMIEKVNGKEQKSSDEKDSGQKSTSGDKERLTFKDKAIIIKQLAEAIGRLVKTEAEIQSSNVISVDSFRAWMGAFVREIKDAFPAQNDQMKFVRISRKIGEPKRG